jgi:hypothetical protein
MDLVSTIFDIETLPALGTLTESETDTRHDPRLSNGDGDHERFAHYVDKNKIVETRAASRSARIARTCSTACAAAAATSPRSDTVPA